MELSISLPEADVAAPDADARTAGLASRSAVLQRALQLLRLPDLEEDYASAWAD